MTQDNTGVITCKAAVVRELGGPLKVEEIKVEPPKGSEVRIKMLYASICHTDILCCNGFPVPLFPRIPGHEGVGMVESIGPEVKTGLKPGDIVMPLFVGECGSCYNCKSGGTNICQKYLASFSGLMADNTSRMSVAATGETVYHHLTCSTWSEYTVVDINFLLKVDPKVSLPHVSFLSCGFTTGFGAPWKEAQVPKGSTVAVFGLGAVGLGVIKSAQLQGTSKIIGIDVNSHKEAKGKAFGMTDFVNPKAHPDKTVAELVRGLTDGLGVDYSFECTGITSLLNDCLDASKIGLGTTVSIGMGVGADVTVTALNLIFGRTLKGTTFGGVKTRTDLPVILDKCLHKEIDLDELITHEIRLENVPGAFDIVKKPECLKILIKF